MTVVRGAQGTEVKLTDLLLDQPRGKLIIAQDGTVNLTQIGKVDPLTVPPTAAMQAAPAPVDADKTTRIKVDRLQVTGGDIKFADLSPRPQFGVQISDLAELIVGQSTKLSLDLEYKINQRKLMGENQIIIDNLMLGERVDS